MLFNIHHIAIICSDYERSKKFYTEVLQLTVVREVYRIERSWHSSPRPAPDEAKKLNG